MQSVDTIISFLESVLFIFKQLEVLCGEKIEFRLRLNRAKIVTSCEKLIIVKYYFCFGHFRDVSGSQTECCEGTKFLKHRVNSEKLLIRRWLCTYLKSWSEWHIPLLKNYEGHSQKVSKSPPVDESPLLFSLGSWIKIWQSRGKSLCSKNFVISWPNLLRLKMLPTSVIAIILANTNYRNKRVLHSSESPDMLKDFTLSREPTKLQINTCERELVQQRDGREPNVPCTPDTEIIGSANKISSPSILLQLATTTIRCNAWDLGSYYSDKRIRYGYIHYLNDRVMRSTQPRAHHLYLFIKVLLTHIHPHLGRKSIGSCFTENVLFKKSEIPSNINECWFADIWWPP